MAATRSDPSPVDWAYARVVAKKVSGTGPQIGLEQAKQAVRELHECAAEATPLIAELSKLDAPANPGSVIVVDRVGWTDANAKAFSSLLGPLLGRLQGSGGALPQGFGARVAGAEIGAALGFLSTKVLGQYELFTEGPDVPPRLMLVAPNIVKMEMELGVIAAGLPTVGLSARRDSPSAVHGHAVVRPLASPADRYLSGAGRPRLG